MLTKYGKALQLKGTFGKIKDSSQNLYCCLITSVNSISDTVAGCTGYEEVAATTTVNGTAYSNGYARQPLVKWNSSQNNFESVFGSPEEGTGDDAGYVIIKNTSAIEFPENYNETLDANVDLNGGNPIAYFGIVDALSGGNLVAYWALGADAITVSSADAIKPTIRAGKMKFRVAPESVS